MSFNNGPVNPSTRYSASYFNTWGPYWDVMFPAREVSAWISLALPAPRRRAGCPTPWWPGPRWSGHWQTAQTLACLEALIARHGEG